MNMSLWTGENIQKMVEELVAARKRISELEATVRLQNQALDVMGEANQKYMDENVKLREELACADECFDLILGVGVAAAPLRVPVVGTVDSETGVVSYYAGGVV